MNVLITGGAGFIGSYLSEELLKRKYKVFVIDNLSTGSFQNIYHLIKNKNFNFVYETILNENVMDRLISNVDFCNPHPRFIEKTIKFHFFYKRNKK